DEEQRFGVAQKEKLKKLAIGADVLTLTATPIPRTLNMAIGGILDLSILDDVPGVRSPVQTYVLEHDDAILYEAIRRELRRGGQVFYLHNRIESIYSVAHRIEQAIPDARVAVGHGRLDRSEIEDIWTSLVKGEIDVLVSTTIIETGVDVPNANTLIIDNADRYGLAQLHQIRGRVGRSSRKAYAYFTYPRTKILSEVAEKRLRAIKEYASFGAGFKIAMRDMEIRGAGNLLGAEQHGHIESVGYDMYLKLLAEAVLEEEGRPVEKPRECQVAIRTDAFISKRYVSDSGQRMEMYKKIARISCEEDYDDVIDEFCDRFGDIPTETLSLCTISLIRARGERCGLSKIEQKEREISLYPESPDPFMLTHIMARYEKGEGQLRLSGVCSLTFKIPKGARAVDCADRITKIYCDAYNEYIEKNKDKDEGTEEVTE
ncbi:MAG: transcription-repair coupling factor, partial [Clostridia bacterium]|nr:transcription-repair coupling factor [Clostridia bacterium]